MIHMNYVFGKLYLIFSHEHIYVVGVDIIELIIFLQLIRRWYAITKGMDN